MLIARSLHKHDLYRTNVNPSSNDNNSNGSSSSSSSSSRSTPLCPYAPPRPAALPGAGGLGRGRARAVGLII
eukprot:1678942-Heterocapsa_arctica.AAC.1